MSTTKKTKTKKTKTKNKPVIWGKVLKTPQKARISLADQIGEVEHQIEILSDSFTNVTTGAVDDEIVIGEMERLEAVIESLKELQKINKSKP